MMSLEEFYAGRSVLVTGATGFVGKVLIEKLLRSCPRLRRVFILVRAKRGQTVQQRVETLLNNQLFDRLNEVDADFRKRVVPVAGDILEVGLGISGTDLRWLADEVSVVFHSAATVKFDEALKMSVKMNVLGVRKLLELCNQLPKLEAFVHVSTAYANCDKLDVGEQVYNLAVHPQKVMDATEWMDEELLAKLTPQIIAPRPNTYTFTKAMAEHVLTEERGTLPCAIVRPSIVGAAWQEPHPGWVDNFNTLTGILAAACNGLLRIFNCAANGTADIIPVDLVVNLVIAAAWHTAIKRPNNVKVFHGTTGQLNRLTWRQIERPSHVYFNTHPVDTLVRMPYLNFTTNKLWYQLNIWFDHLLPAHMVDFVCRLCGKKPQFVQLQERMWRSIRALNYFTSHEWSFDNGNLLTLANQLSPHDRQVFNVDPRAVDWDEYMVNYCKGVKRYMLKQDINNDKPGLWRLRGIMLAWRIFATVSFVAASRLLMRRSAKCRVVCLALLAALITITRRLSSSSSCL